MVPGVRGDLVHLETPWVLTVPDTPVDIHKGRREEVLNRVLERPLEVWNLSVTQGMFFVFTEPSR